MSRVNMYKDRELVRHQISLPKEMDNRVKALGYRTTMEFRAVAMMAFEMYLNAMETPQVFPSSPEAAKRASGLSGGV